MCSLACHRLLVSFMGVFNCSKVKELEEQLHVVTNSLRSLEISESKVCGPLPPPRVVVNPLD